MERVGGGLNTETLCTIPTAACPNNDGDARIGECGPHCWTAVAPFPAPPFQVPASSPLVGAGKTFLKSFGPRTRTQN